MSDIIPFPNPARPLDPAAVCRAAGEEISSPAASRLSPAARMLLADRLALQGAQRLGGGDLAAGYRRFLRGLMVCMAASMGRAATARFLFELAQEARNSGPGPDAA